jgi:hypothetical protein
VSAKTILELVPGDGVDVCMAIAIRLPPVSCCPIKLVRSKKDLLTIHALGDHEFLLDPLKPIFCVYGVLAREKVVGEFAGTQPNETGAVVEVGVLAAGWAACC